MESSNHTNNQKALFLDRDGVIFEELGRYRIAKDGAQLMPGISTLVKTARKKGYIIIVATNQPQIAKGLLSESELYKLHQDMESLLGEKLDAIYYCPHIDEHGCDCRKPKPGLLIRGAKNFNIDCARSFMVGDGDKDIVAGQAVGCKTIFIRNSIKSKYLKNCSPDYVVDSLEEILSLL